MSSFKPWFEKALETGLLSDTSSSLPNARGNREKDGGGHAGRGVSLAWLKRFAASLPQCCDADGGKLSTGDVVAQFVLPMTRGPTGVQRGRSSVWDWVPTEARGPANWYIIHAWDSDFQETVLQVLQRLAPFRPVHQTQVDMTAVFVFFDIVALPQQPLTARQQPLNVGTIKETILGCSSGSILVVDSSLLVLQRLWCMFEVHWTIHNNSVLRLLVSFPAHASVQMVYDFEDISGQLDINKLDCSLPEDKFRILNDMKQMVGTRRIHNGLQEALSTQSKLGLRWAAASQKHIYVYCALLARSAQWHTLQVALVSIPDLLVDKDMLQEIKGIFVMYDDDGSGELDEDEFVKVLSIAGFRPDEARKVYTEVNTDGDGGVSLEEFEAWWIESQKNQQRSRFLKVDMSAKALVANVTNMVAVSERHGHIDISQVFQMTLQQMKADKKFQMDSVDLQPPELSTSDKVNPDVISWRLAGNDVKISQELLYNFLIMNATILTHDPFLIPEPLQKIDMVELCKVTTLYLQHVAELLLLYPERSKQGLHFQRLSDGFKAQTEFWEMGLSMPHLQNKFRAQDKTIWFEFGVLSNMIHLKYGDQQFMSQDLIKEAGKAISSWMASNRLQKRLNGKKTIGDVRDLSNAYLGFAGSDDEEDDAEKKKKKAEGKDSNSSISEDQAPIMPTDNSRDLVGYIPLRPKNEVIKSGKKLPPIATITPQPSYADNLRARLIKLSTSRSEGHLSSPRPPSIAERLSPANLGGSYGSRVARFQAPLVNSRPMLGALPPVTGKSFRRLAEAP